MRSGPKSGLIVLRGVEGRGSGQRLGTVGRDCLAGLEVRERAGCVAVIARAEMWIAARGPGTDGYPGLYVLAAPW
jgi:hypothetical protein